MRHRILVVEDNPLGREFLCDWLEAEGAEVTPVEDLKGAFSALQDHPFDAVLLDIQPGNEDRATLAAWIRLQPALQAIPVIAVTAHAMAAERERILQAGCNARISKPVDFKLLQNQLRLWLAASAASQRGSRPRPETSVQATEPPNGTRGDDCAQ